MGVSEIEEEELKRLNRDIEKLIIIRFRFHPDNHYEKQNGKAFSISGSFRLA